MERVLLVPIRVGLIAARETRTLGAMGILRAPDGRILLVRPFYRTAWGFPGGYLKRRETPAEGLHRELMEETGLEVRADGALPHIAFQRKRRHVDFIYLLDASAADVSRAAPASWEILELAWFAPDDFPPLQPEAETALRLSGLRPG